MSTEVLVMRIQSVVDYIDYRISMHIPIDGLLQGGLDSNLALSK